MVASFVVKFFFEEGKHLGTKQEQRSTVNETCNVKPSEIRSRR